MGIIILIYKQNGRFTDPWHVTVRLEIKLQKLRKWRELKNSSSEELKREHNTKTESSMLIQMTRERRDQTLVQERKRHEPRHDEVIQVNKTEQSDSFLNAFYNLQVNQN